MMTGFLARLQRASTACCEFGLVGADAARRPDLLGKEAFGIIVGLGLHVLAERQRHRAAFGRIGQHLHGAVAAPG